jgi:hypothetical protein
MSFYELSDEYRRGYFLVLVWVALLRSFLRI